MIFWLFFISYCEEYNEITFKPGLNFITEPIIIKKNHTLIDGKGKARLVGGVKLGNFKKVEDESILKRLDESVRKKVYQINLKEYGITSQLPFQEIGYFINYDSSSNHLYIDKQQMNLAHYPRYSTFVNISNKGPFPFAISDGVDINDPRVYTWKFHPNIMAWGYWDYDYTGSLRSVSKIDYDNHKVYFAKPQKAGKNAKLVFYNILEELRYPGDFYIDNSTMILYFYPFGKINSKTEIILSNHSNAIIRARGITDIVIKDISIGFTPRTALYFDWCNSVVIENCEISNIGNVGIYILGDNNTIRNCKIHHTMRQAIVVDSAHDEYTLKYSNCKVINNEVYWYCNMSRNGFTPAFRIEGVGITISHNYIHHGAGHAIFFSGNNIMMEYNEISDIFESPFPTSAFYAGMN